MPWGRPDGTAGPCHRAGGGCAQASVPGAGGLGMGVGGPMAGALDVRAHGLPPPVACISGRALTLSLPLALG